MSDPRAWLDEAQRRMNDKGTKRRPSVLRDTDLPRALCALRAVLDLPEVPPRTQMLADFTFAQGYKVALADVRRVIEAAIHPATLETKE